MVSPTQNSHRSQVAQGVYLAQLEACRSKCNCKTCQLLRKATEAMSDAFLAGEDLTKPGAESIAKIVQEATEIETS